MGSMVDWNVEICKSKVKRVTCEKARIEGIEFQIPSSFNKFPSLLKERQDVKIGRDKRQSKEKVMCPMPTCFEFAWKIIVGGLLHPKFFVVFLFMAMYRYRSNVSTQATSPWLRSQFNANYPI